VTNATAQRTRPSRWLALLLAVVSLTACSGSQFSDLPDTFTYEPSEDSPTQKYSTTYQPNDNNLSSEPNQVVDD
jgi:hypothetical protein